MHNTVQEGSVTGRKPTITGCGMKEEKEKRFSKWKFVLSQPDVAMTRRMLIEALSIVLMFVMKNHVYTFNGVIYRQLKGGPIGMELTGVYDLVGQETQRHNAYCGITTAKVQAVCG